MPDIWERISNIRGTPEIAKAYTTIPQWVIGRTAGALWWEANDLLVEYLEWYCEVLLECLQMFDYHN